LTASVERSASTVMTPTMPILSPAASTRVEGRTFGQSTGRSVAASSKFAASSGYRACAARAFSAPRGSVPTASCASAPSTRPKSNSWLPIAPAV
jgi:hypothetical protein